MMAARSGFPGCVGGDGVASFAEDQDEVDAMKRAVRVAQDALEATIPLIKIGMTEKEIASELSMQLLKHGSESELPFPPIVSAGPNSANPHMPHHWIGNFKAAICWLWIGAQRWTVIFPI